MMEAETDPLNLEDPLDCGNDVISHKDTENPSVIIPATYSERFSNVYILLSFFLHHWPKLVWPNFLVQHAVQKWSTAAHKPI